MWKRHSGWGPGAPSASNRAAAPRNEPLAPWPELRRGPAGGLSTTGQASSSRRGGEHALRRGDAASIRQPLSREKSSRAHAVRGVATAAEAGAKAFALRQAPLRRATGGARRSPVAALQDRTVLS